MKRDNIIIEADELLTRLDDPAIQIFDATMLFFNSASDLTAHEIYLQGHIPGAAFLDQQVFEDGDSDYEFMLLPDADLATQIGKIGVAADSEVIVYTTSALPSATRAWWILRYAGHDKVRVLNGGLAAWKQAGGKIEPGARQYEAMTFECRFRPTMFASKEEVLAAMDESQVSIESALPLEMYGGTQISGSSRLSCFELMQEMKYLSSDDVIKSLMKDGLQYDRIITYCGGGIAATVNAIAQLIAGHENVAVYDGSLIEWMGEGLSTQKVE